MVGLAVLISAIVLTPFGVHLLYRAAVGPARAGWRCYSCGFDLRASRSLAGCPECGAPIVPVGSRPPVTRRQRAALLPMALVLLLPAASLVPQILMLPIVQRMFPGVVRHRILMGATASYEPAVNQLAVNEIRAYAAGGSNDRLMRAAVHAAMFQLTHSRTRTYGHFERSHIAGNVNTPALSALADSLDDPELPDDRFDQLLQATLATLRTLPLENTSPVDDVILDLLAGKRYELLNRRGGDVSLAPRRLTPSQFERALDTILAVQADPDRKWSSLWGLGFEQAALEGHVSGDRLAKYITNSCVPRVVLVGSHPHAGDLVEFRLEMNWRVGSDASALVTARPVDDKWQDRVAGTVRCGAMANSNIGDQRACHGLLALPDHPGPHSLKLAVTMRFGPDVHKAAKERFGLSHDPDHSTIWQSVPARTIAKQATLELDLKSSTAPVVRLEPGDHAAKQIEERLGRPFVLVNSDENRPAIEVRFSSSHIPVPMAATVYVRQDERMHRLGWTLLDGVLDQANSVGGEVPGVDLKKPFELVLRSDAGPLERPYWHPVCWSGEISFPITQPVLATFPDGYGR